MKKWSKIANALFERFGGQRRSGKQCRERWINHLDPDLNKDNWTPEEKQKILEFQEKFGNKWSKISRFFQGRTDNAVKNCFYSIVRKNLRKFNKKKPEDQKIKGNIKDLLRKPHLKNVLFGVSTEKIL